MKQGNVKWFDCKKGYGFIARTAKSKTSSSILPNSKNRYIKNSSTTSASHRYL